MKRWVTIGPKSMICLYGILLLPILSLTAILVVEGKPIIANLCVLNTVYCV